MKLLLSGVPGSGKTTLATYLAEECGYTHVNMEAKNSALRHVLAKDPARMLKEWLAHKNIVISWGFIPFADRSSIDLLIHVGFTLVWLDGNRVASFRAFMEREHNNPIMEFHYYGQMQIVVATEIVKHLNPKIVNPFDKSGDFRSIKDIATEVLSS